MNEFSSYFTSTAHVSDNHALCHAGWVRQACELAGRPREEPLLPESEHQALVKLHQSRREWQIKQARRAVRLYRYFLTSRQSSSGLPPDDTNPAPGGGGIAWGEH